MLLNSAAGNKNLCGSPAIIDQAGLGVHTSSPNLFLRYLFLVQCVLIKVVSTCHPQKRNLVFTMRAASSIAIVLATLAAALSLFAAAARAQLPAGMESILSGVLCN